MKALAVVALLFGVLAILSRPADYDMKDASYRGIALNYAVYRNAVFLFVYGNKGFSGDVPLSSLNLPESWRMLRTWKARVQGGRCYVYGEASPEEVEAVRQLFQGSFAVGMADGGRIVPVMGNPVPVPGFVPAGNLVSVTES